MTSPTRMTTDPDTAARAARVYLSRAQHACAELSLPILSGGESDELLIELADDALAVRPRRQRADELADALSAYRFVRDTGDLMCADTEAYRRELIADALGAQSATEG